MYCRTLFLSCLLACWFSVQAFGATVKVAVKGIEGELLHNVQARLELYLHRNNAQLTAHEIRRLHNRAEKDIRAALEPYGYYEPVIKGELKGEGEHFEASYDVQRGEPVRISTLDLAITGAGRRDFGGVLKRFPLKAGDILNQGVYEQGKKNIVNAAVHRGFLKSKFVVRELKIDRQAKSAEIHLTLDTGPQFLMGETRFTGGSVRAELLQRYLPYSQGEPYRTAKLIELQKLLYQTEFFSKVTVDGLVDEVKDQRVPISVRLVPREHRNRYSVGLGYGTDTGARVKLEWWNRLLNRRGHQIRASIQESQYDKNLELKYNVPWRDPKTDAISYNLGYHDQSWQDTDTRLFTVGTQVEHRGKLISHSGSVDLSNEDYSVGVTSGSSVLLVPTYTGRVIWADNLLNTKYGLDLSLSVSGADERLGSDATFVKTVLNGKTILTLLPGWRVIGRGSLGSIFVNDISEIPPSQRFYAGGDQSVRGYAYKSLGTKDASGAVVGGRYLAVVSAELEKQLTEKWSCAAFWDVGNAVDDLSLDFKQGVGVGVRYRLPFGQVRLDVADAILEGGFPIRLHLTVGADL